MEEWRHIEGYEGIYQVSNKGRIKSLEKQYVHNIYKTLATHKERILKATDNNNGYLQVGFFKNGKRTMCKVHRLVAEAFIPNPENKPEVNHISGIKDDNRVENLEWVTSQENTIHAVKNNLITGKEIKITKNGKTLTFESGAEAAEYINCHPSSICNVANPNGKAKTIYGWSARYIE